MLVGLGAAVYTGYRGYQATTESDRYKNLDGGSGSSADSNAIREFLQALRDERRLSGQVLGDPSIATSQLQAQWQKTDQAATAVRTVAQPVVSQAAIDGLVALRPLVSSRQIPLVDAVDRYSTVIVDADSRRSTSLAAAVADPRVIRQDEINRQLTDLTETLDVSDALSFSAFSAGGMPVDALQAYARQTGDFLSLLTALQAALPPDEAGELNRLTAGPDGEVVAVIQRGILRGSVLRPAPGSPTPARTTEGTQGQGQGQGQAQGQTQGRGKSGTKPQPDDEGQRLDGARATVALPVPQPEWRAATSRIEGGLVALQRKHLEYAAGIAQDVGRQQLGSALIGSLALVAFAALVLLVSLAVSRGLIGRLRRLREDTIELSHTRLPSIVGRLRDGDQVDLDSELPPLRYGSDEIGQVADAFGEAQRTAVDAAAHEAETRAGLRKVFLDIAHRSQAIVYRQLKVLDRAERSQEDPDQLELLFQLDHLATRARRNAENLIILGGGQAGRQWRGAVALLQLIRSAISEAEHYARVRVSTVPEVTIVGGAAADLIHLLAELVDNATAFSPPAAGVEVRANLVGRGLVIEIEDQGLGIQPEQLEELNALLHAPPDFQMMALATEPRLGLFVVARLAARHGIRVTLTTSTAYGGTMVVVLVPTALLTAEPLPTRGVPELVASPGAVRPVHGAQPPGQVVQPMRPVPVPTPVAPVQLASVDRMDARRAGPRRSAGPADPRPPERLPERRPERLAERRPAERPPAGPAYPHQAPAAPPRGTAPAGPPSMGPPMSPPPMSPPPMAPTRSAPAPMPAAPSLPVAPSLPMAPMAPPPVAAAPPPGPGRPYAPPPGHAPPHHGGPPGPARPAPGAASGAGGAGRPDLPRRSRMTHMSPKLLHTPAPVAEVAPRPSEPAPVDAETARSRMSALQRGTIRGRATDPEEPR